MKSHTYILNKVKSRAKTYRNFSLIKTNIDIYNCFITFFQQEYAHYEIVCFSDKTDEILKLYNRMLEEFIDYNNFNRNEKELVEKNKENVSSIFVVYNQKW